jgi:hypothetical protein
MKTITLATRDGKTETVPAIVLQRFAVHRGLDSHRGVSRTYPWVVTHIKTGRLMPHKFRTRALALQLARRLDGMAGYDALPVEIPTNGLLVAEYRELVTATRAVYEELGV